MMAKPLGIHASFQEQTTMQLDMSSTRLLDVLRALNSITEKVADYDKDFDELLEAILALTTSILDVSYGSILLLDRKDSKFRTVATHGDFPVGLDLKAVSDISKLKGCPSISGQKLLLTEFVADSEWNNLNPEERRHLENVHCSPLLIHQRIAGVVCVYGNNFIPNALQTEVFCLLANFASITMEKSQLYGQISKRLELTREELKQTQSQLIRSEKLSSLAEIAMSVAHSIRNPVTVIGGMSRRIEKNLPTDDPKHEWIQMILNQSSRLEKVVSDFMRFFTIKQISLRPEDVNRVVDLAVDDFLSRCEEAPDFTLERRLWVESLICLIDVNLLKRCLMHLMANAREASTNSLHITITTQREGDEALIDVSDTGRGMSREVLDHIFDPFFTTKQEGGAGMGLTFVHFIIGEHAGKIELKSEKGKGTRFRIRLPLNDGDEAIP